MPDKSFFDRCASMSFGKLRDYIDSCLSALASGRPDANIPSLGKDDFLKLSELLHAKVDEPPVLWDDEQKTYLQPPVAPPQFPAFAPSEQLGGLLRELNQLQSQLSERRADRNATKRSIKKLEHKIQDLKDDVEPLKSRELTAYEAKEAAYYKEYRAQLSKWKRMTLAQESVELQRLRHNQAVKAQYEHSRADRVRFCERIRRDIERIFTPTYKVFWRILPPGEWTVDSVVSHYAELQRANPHVRFDLDRLRRV